MDISMNSNETPGAEPPRSDGSSAQTGSRLPPKRLQRDPSGPLGGVAGGFAGYFDVDPVLSRLLWIVALFSGIGFPAYLVCWLVIPKAKVWPPPGYGVLSPSAQHPNQTALLSGLVILGLVAVVGSGVGGLGQYLLPAALVGVGVYLLSQRPASADPELPAASAAGADPLAGGAALELAPWSDARAGAREERAGLVTPTVLSVLAILAGVFAALHAGGLLHVSVGALAAGGLVVVGGGLLASLWLGRARGLLPLGLALVCTMLAAPTIGSWVDAVGSEDEPAVGAVLGQFGHAPNQEGTGKITFSPNELEELQPEYELGVGALTLDLSALDFSQASRDLRVEVGVGELIVIVPGGAPVEVQGEVGLGEAHVLGKSRKGMGQSLEVSEVPGGATGKLSLDLELGIGKVEVRRAP